MKQQIITLINSVLQGQVDEVVLPYCGLKLIEECLKELVEVEDIWIDTNGWEITFWWEITKGYYIEGEVYEGTLKFKKR